MSIIRFHETTTATPEQFVAGLTDFGPGRSQLFKNSADGYLKVHIFRAEPGSDSAARLGRLRLLQWCPSTII